MKLLNLTGKVVTLRSGPGLNQYEVILPHPGKPAYIRDNEWVCPTYQYLAVDVKHPAGNAQVTTQHRLVSRPPLAPNATSSADARAAGIIGLPDPDIELVVNRIMADGSRVVMTRVRNLNDVPREGDSSIVVHAQVMTALIVEEKIAAALPQRHDLRFVRPDPETGWSEALYSFASK